jgi:hypothetical protein
MLSQAPTSKKQKFTQTISLDEVSWAQSHEMANEHGLCLSAMLRVLIRNQYQQRKRQGKASI